MISLHAILAAEGLIAALPNIILWVAGVLIGIAFAFGFVKGFRMVSWDGLAWFVASILFLIIGAIVPMKGSTPAGGMAISLVVAIACILGTFALFGVLSQFLRPKMRWIKDNINSDMSLAEFGLEFEPEYLDYDGEHDYAPYGKRIYKTGYGTPSFAFRLIGGLTCAINIGIVLWTLVSVFLLIVHGTALNDMAISGIFENEAMLWLLKDAQGFLFEILSIGIIMFFSRMGYEKGLINSVRSFAITVGGFVAVGLSFSMPFTATPETNPLMATIVERCCALFTNMAFFGDVLGKLLAGVCMLVLFVIALVLLNVLLKRVCSMIESTGLTREVDGWLAVVLYTLIGAAVCVGFWFLMAALDELGILYISKVMNEAAYLSSNIFEFAKSIIAPLFAGTGAGA